MRGTSPKEGISFWGTDESVYHSHRGIPTGILVYTSFLSFQLKIDNKNQTRVATTSTTHGL